MEAPRTVEEAQHVLSLLFFVYLLTVVGLSFALRSAVQTALKSPLVDRCWGRLCAGVIMPRLFGSAFALFVGTAGFLSLGKSWWELFLGTVSSTAQCALGFSILVTLAVYALAGNTPRKVLPRVYLALAIPVSLVTWGAAEFVW